MYQETLWIDIGDRFIIPNFNVNYYKMSKPITQVI